MKDISAETWKEDVLDQPLVLVDFWAPWCGPCKTMLPILEQVENEIPNVQVVKVNADEHPDLVDQFEIKSIPTMMLYKEGEHVWTLTGGKPFGMLVEHLAPFI